MVLYKVTLQLSLPLTEEKHTSYRNKLELAHSDASAPMAVGGIGWDSNTYSKGTAVYLQKLTHKVQKPSKNGDSLAPSLGPLHTKAVVEGGN